MDAAARVPSQGDRVSPSPAGALAQSDVSAAMRTVASAAVPSVSMRLPDLLATMRLFMPSLSDPAASAQRAGLAKWLSGAGGEDASLSLRTQFATLLMSDRDPAHMREVFFKAVDPAIRARFAQVLREGMGVATTTSPELTESRARKTLQDFFPDETDRRSPVSSHDHDAERCIGCWMYATDQQRGLVRVRGGRRKKNGCFFEMSCDSETLGPLLFGLTMQDNAVSLDIWASDATVRIVSEALGLLVGALRAKGLALSRWQVRSFSDEETAVDVRA